MKILKRQIQNIISEQVKLITEGNLKIFNIKDLAKMITHQFDNDEETYKIVLDELNKAYRENGDQGVMELFTAGAGFEITPLSHGRYYIK